MTNSGQGLAKRPFLLRNAWWMLGIVAAAVIVFAAPRSWRCAPGAISYLQFSQDGQRLAIQRDHYPVSDLLQMVSIWSVSADQQIREIAPSGIGYGQVAFAPDGSLIATGRMDGLIHLWEVDSGTKRSTLKGPETGIRAISFAPDSKSLATSGFDDAVQIWDAQTGQLLQTAKGSKPTIGILQVVYVADNKTLLTAGSGDSAKLWDIQQWKVLREFGPALSAQNAAAVAPDGKTIIVGGLGTDAPIAGVAILWDAQTGQRLQTLTGHRLGVDRVQYAPDSSLVYTLSPDGTFKLWEVNSGKLRLSSEHTISAAFAPDSKTLLTANENNTLLRWDTQTGAVIRTVDTQGHRLYGLRYTPDGTRFVTGDEVGNVIVWSASGEQLHPLCPTLLGPGWTIGALVVGGLLLVLGIRQNRCTAG